MRHVGYDVADLTTWVCWGAVALTWAVGAMLDRRGHATVRQREGRDFASLFGVIVGVILVATPASLWRPLSVGSPWIRIAGIAVMLPATLGALWARGSLGAMWSSAALTKDSHELRTSGPYRITRHPIYTAILAMLAGTALTQGLGRWVALLAAVAVVLVAKLRAEERLLTQEFPDQYDRYRQQVPQLVPRPQLRGGRRS